MKEIKIGDWVRIPAINEKGKVIGAYVDKEWNERGYHVRMEDGRELDVLESNCELADYDPKTAFLTELQSLLRKYEACIYDYEQYELCIDFANGDSISWYWGDKPIKESFLTPDNIFNYEKE